MRFQIKIATLLTLLIFFNYAHADAFVCVDQHGKKVFVTESCEKQGMKVGTHDFPVVSGQSISAVIIAPPDEKLAETSQVEHLKVKKGTWDFREGNLKISPIILVFLLFSLTGMGFILIYQVVVYFKNHRRQLVWANEVENIAPTKNSS